MNHTTRTALGTGATIVAIGLVMLVLTLLDHANVDRGRAVGFGLGVSVGILWVHATYVLPAIERFGRTDQNGAH